MKDSRYVNLVITYNDCQCMDKPCIQTLTIFEFTKNGLKMINQITGDEALLLRKKLCSNANV